MSAELDVVHVEAPAEALPTFSLDLVHWSPVYPPAVLASKNWQKRRALVYRRITRVNRGRNIRAAVYMRPLVAVLQIGIKLD